jgi:hypothetical protein
MLSVVTTLIVVGVCFVSGVVADATAATIGLQRRARQTRVQSTAEHVEHRHQGGQLKGILEAPGSLVRVVYEDRFDVELVEMEAALVVFADPTSKISSKTDAEVRPPAMRSGRVCA